MIIPPSLSTHVFDVEDLVMTDGNDMLRDSVCFPPPSAESTGKELWLRILSWPVPSLCTMSGDQVLSEYPRLYAQKNVLRSDKVRNG